MAEAVTGRRSRNRPSRTRAVLLLQCAVWSRGDDFRLSMPPTAEPSSDGGKQVRCRCQINVEWQPLAARPAVIREYGSDRGLSRLYAQQQFHAILRGAEPGVGRERGKRGVIVVNRYGAARSDDAQDGRQAGMCGPPTRHIDYQSPPRWRMRSRSACGRGMTVFACAGYRWAGPCSSLCLCLGGNCHTQQKLEKSWLHNAPCTQREYQEGV